MSPPSAPRRPITLIVIHCSASSNGRSLSSGTPGTPEFKGPDHEIDLWHGARGFYRSPDWKKCQNPHLGAIGYHFVIGTNGALYTGRHLDEVGAHARGYNQKSLGVCLIGTDRFSAAQWGALAGLIVALQKQYPEARVVGHRDLSPDLNGNGRIEPNEYLKTCPGFYVAGWLARGMVADPDHTLDPGLRRGDG